MSAWKAWLEVFPDTPPMGDLLRAAAPTRWVRIHNLPGGKRTPRDRDEATEALFRNNIAASAILGIGSSCAAFLSEWDESEAFSSWSVIGAAPGWNLDEDAQEQVLSATFRSRSLRWRPGELDDEILAAACGEAGRLAVLSLATQAAYCPYEGGADLFVRDSSDTSSLKRLLAKWLSDDKSGL